MHLSFASRFVLARAIHIELANVGPSPTISGKYSQLLIAELLHDLGGLAGEW